MSRHRWLEVGRIVVVGVIVAAYQQSLIPLPLLWAAVVVGLYPLAKTGAFDLKHEHRIGTEVFVTLATVFALIGGEATAGAVLMVIILFAEFIADLNTDRARSSIRGLIGSAPSVARVREGNQERLVPIGEVQPGAIVLVRAGDQIPVDGTVISGAGAVDEASITGESVPKDKATASAVFAGTLLESGTLDVRTERAGNETTFARIASLVEEAESSQAPVQKLADRISTWLIPVVIVFLIIVFLVTRDVRKVVTLMVFTSPAELGLATPMVMIAAIARAARSGILVKGGIHLETLAQVDTVVFDKTGTLTVGSPQVRSIDPVGSQDANDMLRLAASLDRRSGHPLAEAVVHAARDRQLTLGEPTDFESVPGRGVTGTIDGHSVLVGNAALLTERAVVLETGPDDATQTTIYVAVDGEFAGTISIVDELRPGAKDAIAHLRRTGVQRIAMLTGDSAAIAGRVASELGIDEVIAELLPEGKVEAIRKMQASGHLVAMVGDGVNDSPALAAADVGIAMGAAGTQAAIEAADVALMTDDLSRIPLARAIARRAYRTIKENIFVGVGVVHVLGITAALIGLIGPIQAAMLHLGPDILVFLNSTKLLRVRIDE